MTTIRMREKLRLALGRAMLDQLEHQKAMAFWDETEAGGKISLAGDLEPSALLDAILDTLREPDEGMIAAGFEAGRFMLTAGAIYSEYSEDPAELDGDAPAAILSAMIDHVRKG